MADASEEFRRVFTGALEEESGLELAAETGDGQETVRLAKELSPDIVVMDFVLARMDGLEVLSELAALPGRPRVLVLSSFVYSYFKFTWALRQFNLLSILVGAAPFGKTGEPGIDSYAQRLAKANSLAGDDFNRGIRAYYFGLAASGWLIGAIALGVLALAVLVILYRRDYRSEALALLREP